LIGFVHGEGEVEGVQGMELLSDSDVPP